MTIETVEEPRQADGPAPPVEKLVKKKARPPRSRLRAVRTFVVVVALLAGAAYGGTHVARQRLAAAAFVDIGNAVLTAEAVPVGSADAGVVTEILVTEQDRVAAGQDLAKITLTANGTNKQPPVQILRAPTAGTVSTIDVAVGSVARAGEPVLILYDQNHLTFQAQVPVKDLRELRLGMAAFITGPGLERPVEARLDHVVPRVGSAPVTATDRLTVVLVPQVADVDRVSRLVPGLQFKTTVDTKTAPGATPAVNRAG
jgi:multidrug resistance efflux pump